MGNPDPRKMQYTLLSLVVVRIPANWDFVINILFGFLKKLLETLGFAFHGSPFRVEHVPGRPARALGHPVLRKNGLRFLWVATVFSTRGRSNPSELGFCYKHSLWIFKKISWRRWDSNPGPIVLKCSFYTFRL